MCLLGTNGSGKTTLVNMLTGLEALDRNSGNVTLNFDGHQVSIRDSARQFRSYVRLCQQNDFLFEELTCKEHLELVCKLRGIVSKEDIEKCVMEKMNEVTLDSEISK